MGARKPKPEAPVDTRPAPFEKEQARIAAARERWVDRTPPVQIQRNEDGVGASPHSDDSGWTMRIGDAFGTRSPEFMSQALAALNATTRSRDSADATEQQWNAAIALVSAIAPENELEAALAVQMASNHALTTDIMGRAASTMNRDFLQLYGNLAVKLQRTFTAQIEALARMRGKGQQTVRVEHVTVEAGAQAIVGDVHHHQHRGAGAPPRTEERPHEPGRTATIPQASTALPGPDSKGNGVPISSDAERAVPHPRRPVARRPRKPKRA